LELMSRLPSATATLPGKPWSGRSDAPPGAPDVAAAGATAAAAAERGSGRAQRRFGRV
jgi:hypothetical protein